MRECTSCGANVRGRLSLLGLTISSDPRCHSCGVYYCDRCRRRLRDKKVQWWRPTYGQSKACRKCGGGVPKPLRWYHYLLP